MSRPPTPTAAFVVLLAACAGGEPAEQALTAEHDSAGVRIVENRWAPERLESGWVLEAGAEVTIGVFEGEDSYQLFNVSGGTLLDDGRIALVNAGTHELRVFDREGRFVAAHGGEGDGPGEFQSPTLVGRLGDTLVVYDFNQRRTSLVHPEAGFVRSFPVGAEGGGFPVPQGMFEDGSLTFGGGMTFSSDEGFPSGVVRTPSPYRSVTPHGEAGADFGEFPGSEMFARVSEQGFMARGLPFGRFTSAATGDSVFYLGTADAYEILAFAPTGSLAGVIRMAAPVRPVTADLREAYVVEALERADDEAERIELRQLLRDMPYGESVPPYGAMTVDHLNHLWVADFVDPGADTMTWTVFDARGHAVGRIPLPGGVRVLEIGADYLLLRTRDELDVEQVELRRLRRPAG